MSIRTKLSRLKRKLTAIAKVIRSDDIAYSGLIRPEDQIKGIILSTLRRHLKMADNVEQENSLLLLTDYLINDILINPEGPLRLRIQDTVDSMFSGVYWYYCTLSGAATLWELKVRILASRLNIQIEKPIYRRNKRARNVGIVEFHDLGPIVDQLRIEFPFIAVDFSRLINLRDALVHGNFHKLRAEANLPQSKKLKDSYKGNVIALGLEAGTVTNLSDQLEEEVREEQDIYAWFLEASSSNLLKEVFKEFEIGLRNITLLIDFKSMAFGNRINLFESVFRDGNWVPQEQMESLRKDFKIIPYHATEDTTEYLSKIKQLQRQKKP